MLRAKYVLLLFVVLLADALCAVSTSAYAADTDCVPKGGKTSCPPLRTPPWGYNMCPTGIWNFNNTAAMCYGNGGAWDGVSCAGGAKTPFEDYNAALGAFVNYVDYYYEPCSMTATSTPTYNTLNCGATTSRYVNDIPAVVGNLHSFEGYMPDPANGGSCTKAYGEGVVISGGRDVSCDMGTSTRTGSDGSTECTSNAGCGDGCGFSGRVGNPIDVSFGTKSQVEVDYPARGQGTLAFVRYYYSGGYFDLAPREPAITDYWRHTYSGVLLAYQGNAYVMAAVIRPTGGVRYFNLSGAEIQNQAGDTFKLEKLTGSGGALTGWKLTTSQHDVEMYDPQGKLSSVTTRDGFATTLAYNASGRLESATDAFGRTLTFTYNADGLLASMTDPSNRTYGYAYDDKKRLSTVTFPDTKTRTYLYEDTKWIFALTGIVDERNLRISTYAYDALGRANSTEHEGGRNKYTVSWGAGSPTTQFVTVTDAFGAVHSYEYAKVGGIARISEQSNNQIGTRKRSIDANGNPSSVTDARNTVTTFTFDSTRNLETSRTEASGTSLARTITTTWHPTYRQIATITEPSGVAGINLVTELTHDTAGNVTKKKLTAGTKVREWNYTVNGRGQILTADGPRTDVSDVTTMTYHPDNDSCAGCRGQVHTVTNALGHVTTFNSYNADSRPTQITDANGVVTALTYKTRGWLESRTVGGETTSFDYDSAGNLVRVTLPDSSWVGYHYDSDNRLTGMDDSLGNAIDYELDIMGNRVREKAYDPQDALRRTHQSIFDGGNRLKDDVGADGHRLTYTYDANNNVTKLTDQLFRVTTNTYDVHNRLTNVNDPASGNTVFTYDAKDRLLTVKDPKLAATTTYTYDGLGNLLTQVSPDTGTTTFTYDNAGNVLTQTDARSVVTTFTYDALNRVTAATVTDGTVAYEYDNVTTGGVYAKGRLTKVTDPSGFTSYVYDSLGRISSKTQNIAASPAAKSFTTAYGFSQGRPSSVTYPSGRVVTYGYNAQGQVTAIAVDSAALLSGATYAPFGSASGWTWANGQAMSRGFDLDGRVKSYTLGPSTGTYADLSQVFGYDALNRLTSAQLAAGQTQGFTYDANSNRLTATINGALTSYTYPTTSHRLTSLSGATTRSFTYDNAGNTTVTQGVTYLYDGRGRMKQAGTTTYLVNGLGQRVKKSTSPVETYFAYDEEGRLIGEYDTAGAPIQETVWLGDLPVGIIKPNTPSGHTVYYVWADHLGTPRVISDASNQARWEWPHTDPFGNNLPNENPAGAGTFTYNLRFPGQYFDPETGKHYNYFRDYDPGLGRYLQSDLIGLRGGLNTFTYALSNSLRYVDWLGLEVFLCHQPAFGWMPVGHYWIKTSTREAGMGGTRGNVPGNQSGDRPGDPVQVTDHTGRSGEWTALCMPVKGVDEDKVNDQLTIGRPLGRWGPRNHCQSFVKEVLSNASSSKR